MASDRWEEIERVYQAALEMDARRRPAYLDQACGGDEELRREAESLLAYESAADRFLEEPVQELRPKARKHPFTWIVWGAAALVAASFIYAGMVLTKPGAGFGWNGAARGGVWRIESVDTQGPAAGLLRRGDQLVRLNGDPNVSRAGPAPHRRMMSIGDTYRLTILRDGEEHERELTVSAAPGNVGLRLMWFVVTLIWCAIALFIGFVRPDRAVARLAFAAALATGLLFLHNSVSRFAVPLWAPLHVVLGYHFFLLFPNGLAPGGAWKAALYVMYGFGGFAMLTRYVQWAFNLSYGPEAATQLLVSIPAVFGLANFLSLFAYCAAILGMVAVIPWNYRRLTDEDQRRRVHWVALGSAVAMAGQLWWTALLVFEYFAGSTGVARNLDLSELTLAIPVTVAYAVVKHRVFDVRVVIRRGIQYLLAKRALQALTAAPLIAIAIVVVTHRDRTIAELVSGNTEYLYWLAAAGLSLTFRRPAGLWLDRKFFREEYDREQVLCALIDDLGHAESTEQLSGIIRTRLEFALHPKDLYFWSREARTLENSSGQVRKDSEFPSGGRLLQRLERHPAVMDVSSVSTAKLTAEEASWFAGLGATLLIPVKASSDRLAEVWMLAERKSETPYSPTDRRLLHAIAKQTAVMRENFRLRAQVRAEERVRRDVFAHLARESFNLLKECPTCGRCFDNTAGACDRDGQSLTLALPVERTIDGKYRLDQLIGRGGMGAVYEACDLRLRRTVAVKIMIGRTFGQQTALRRFEREARAAASLNHPNIVSIFDFGRLGDEGRYLVMERIYGPTMRATLNGDGALTPRAAAEWFDPLLEGLAAAHKHGIVHRDLKPENVIAAEDHSDSLTVKILDFGLARFTPVETPQETPTSSLTAGGFVAGTLGYMSPEHLAGRKVDQRSDIFAVGVMLIEALTGRKPFLNEEGGLFLTAPSGQYRLPCLSPESRALDDLVRRCLAKHPQDRFESAAELRQKIIPALRACRSLGEN